MIPLADNAKPEVVLIFPRTIEIDFISVDVPYSIFFVGSYLKQHGYSVKLFDQRKTPVAAMLRYIEERDVRYVGLSTMTGPQLMFAEDISQQVRRLDPGITIIWGGVHPTIAPETVLELDCVDYVARGEGEETCRALLDALTAKTDVAAVASVSWKGPDGRMVSNPDRAFMNVDSVSLDWSLVDAQAYVIPRNGKRSLAFITSRGCPFRCQFCWDVIVYQRTFRHWSEARLVEELDKLLVHDIEYIEFLDDNIGSIKNHLFRVCDYLRDRNIQWFSSLRSDFVSRPGIIERLHNLHDCYLGVESGSQRVLDAIKKDQKVQSIVDAAEALKRVGARGNYSWIIGLPGEEREDLEQTLALVDRIATIQPEAPQRLRIYSPYPGAPLYERAVELGYKKPTSLYEWSRLSRENCELDYIVDKWELKTISYASYFKFYMFTHHQVKPLYYVPALVLWSIAALRWKYKFFKVPAEIYLVEVFRRFLASPMARLQYRVRTFVSGLRGPRGRRALMAGGADPR